MVKINKKLCWLAVGILSLVVVGGLIYWGTRKSEKYDMTDLQSEGLSSQAHSQAQYTQQQPQAVQQAPPQMMRSPQASHRPPPPQKTQMEIQYGSNGHSPVEVYDSRLNGLGVGQGLSNSAPEYEYL